MLERLRRLSLRSKVLAVTAFVVVLGAGPAWAYWTASRSVTNTQTFNIGHLDLQLNGKDTTAALSLNPATGMYPGSTAAGNVTISNAGTLPFSFWITIQGTAQTKGMADALDAKMTTGTASGGTCGGTPVGSVAPINVGTEKVVAYGKATSGRQVLAAAAAPLQLCLQLTLETSAATTVQGGSASISITATGTQVGAP